MGKKIYALTGEYDANLTFVPAVEEHFELNQSSWGFAKQKIQRAVQKLELWTVNGTFIMPCHGLVCAVVRTFTVMLLVYVWHLSPCESHA